jgi:hypothetical protein
VHDYGMGGTPCYIWATSFASMRAKYPELELVDDEERFFQNQREGLRGTVETFLDAHTYDIDASPSGFLQDL